MTDTTDDDAEDNGESDDETEQMAPETGAMTQRPAHLRDDATPEHGARDAEDEEDDDG